MKNLRTISFLFAAVNAACILSGCSKTAVEQPAHDYSSIAEIEEAANAMYDEYVQSISERKDAVKAGSMKAGSKTMKFSFEVIGTPPKDGYPIYIALRGGGVGDKAVADEQYASMKKHYRWQISTGIYIVPYGITVSWDEHYQPESYVFYDEIIETAAALYQGDINRVYLLGFSSGGDGVYAIAPHMADRFAAVNMSAGYPHVLKIGNMYNLPICLQMGENDSAWDRNTAVAEYDALLYEYANRFGGGFPHDTYIHVRGTHNQGWSDWGDQEQSVITGAEVAKWAKNRSSAKQTKCCTDAVSWLRRNTRDPLPQRVVWETEIYAEQRSSYAFYWLDRDEELTDVTVDASYDRDSNSVQIRECDAEKGTLKIYLNPKMLDVFAPVQVEVRGKTVSVQPVVSERIMHETLNARGDQNYIFTSEIDITFDGNGEPADICAVS